MDIIIEKVYPATTEVISDSQYLVTLENQHHEKLFPVRRILAAYECETEQIIKALNITKRRSSVRVQKNRGEVWEEEMGEKV